MFERNLEQSSIDKLKENDLWINHLKKDCEEQNVFLAIRKDNVGFYHKGGKLFGFDEKNGFRTHIKYAAVIDETEKDYLTEKELENSKLISNFSDNYIRIKENCKHYSKDEALGVSEIYHNHSYLSKERYVVLDIEVSFKPENENEKEKKNRIDILLFDTETKNLQFVEAKHFSNSEIWSTKKPEVINQIKRYENQIKKSEKQIIEAYKKYVSVINEIFGLTLPPPLKVYEKVKLFIFGFDENQRKGRLTELILDKREYKEHEVMVYSRGNTGNFKDLETLWEKNLIKKS